MVRTPEISSLWERAPARESALWERAPAREWITRTTVFARRGALPHRYVQHP